MEQRRSIYCYSTDIALSDQNIEIFKAISEALQSNIALLQELYRNSSKDIAILDEYRSATVTISLYRSTTVSLSLYSK